jgi:D-alanine-D-alanine ligase
MSKRKIMVLMHESLVPPADTTGIDVVTADWRTEFGVADALRKLGHEVLSLGVAGDLAPIRNAIRDFQPEIAFNLLEAFDDVVTWDQNVVAYLELMKCPYTGCNSRGLILGRDKALTKKLLTYHRIPVPDFALFPIGRAIKRPRKLAFPLIVKSLTLDASIGIAQASLVDSDEKLAERVRFIHESIGTDAIAERYIEGRELYVGVLGNHRLQALPVWELNFANLPVDRPRIATERLKSAAAYRQKYEITTGPAADLPPGAEPHIQDVCKRVYRVLHLSGYARIDLRLDAEGKVFVLEANPNPELFQGEDFAESAVKAGVEYGPLLQRIVNLGLGWSRAMTEGPPGED